jgi:S1-C subfamily serine protease
MMRLIIVLLLASLIMLCSCIPQIRYQTVGSKERCIKVYNNNAFIGEGDSVQIWFMFTKVIKQNKGYTFNNNHQYRIEADSCKPLFFSFSSERHLDVELTRYPYWDSTQNKVYFDEVNLDSLANKVTITRNIDYIRSQSDSIYVEEGDWNYNEDIKQREIESARRNSINEIESARRDSINEIESARRNSINEIESARRDSINKANDEWDYTKDIREEYMDSTTFVLPENITREYINDLNEVLNQTRYIDSSQSIYTSTNRIILLNCSVENLSIIEYKYKDIQISSDFIFTLTDFYKDTLFVKTINSESGNFTTYNKKIKNVYSKALYDAILSAYCKLGEDPDYQKALGYHGNVSENHTVLKINKPSRTMPSIKECMTASVTIENSKGHGSGFAISEDGYIITNLHVVANKEDLKIILNSGEELDAEIARSNKFHDIALLKVDHKFEFAYTLPEKTNFDIGSDVIAIGTPKSIELGQSVAKGIISGLREKNDLHIIQTDASINYGNSGGPLITSKGELIGIIQYKMLGFGTEGISFAIPAYQLKRVMNIRYRK